MGVSQTHEQRTNGVEPVLIGAATGVTIATLIVAQLAIASRSFSLVGLALTISTPIGALVGSLTGVFIGCLLTVTTQQRWAPPIASAITGLTPLWANVGEPSFQDFRSAFTTTASIILFAGVGWIAGQKFYRRALPDQERYPTKNVNRAYPRSAARRSS